MRRSSAPPSSARGGAALDLHRDRAHHQHGGALRGLGPGRRDRRRARHCRAHPHRLRPGEPWREDVQERLAAGPRLPRHPAEDLREDRLGEPAGPRRNLRVGRPGPHRVRGLLSAEVDDRRGAAPVLRGGVRRGGGERSYYAIPDIRNTLRWVERTPPSFVFHVKAYSLLTGHTPARRVCRRSSRRSLPRRPADASRRDRRVELHARGGGSGLPPLEGGRRSDRRSREARLRPVPVRAVGPLRARAARLSRLAPAAAARVADRGRVPPSLVAARSHRRDPARAGRRPSDPRDRGRSGNWARGAAGDDGDRADRGLPAARSQPARLAPPGSEEKPTVQEKYDYLYSERELQEFLPEIEGASGEAEEVFISFNNNNRDYPVQNALMMKRLLGQPTRSDPVPRDLFA